MWVFIAKPKTHNILKWHSEVDHFTIRSNERSLTFPNTLPSAFPRKFLSYMTTMTPQSQLRDEDSKGGFQQFPHFTVHDKKRHVVKWDPKEKTCSVVVLIMFLCTFWYILIMHKCIKNKLQFFSNCRDLGAKYFGM